LPFLISCTRAHLRMAELGCLASMPLQHIHRYGSAAGLGRAQLLCWAAYIFSSTMPLAWEAPAKGFFHSLPKWDFL
jgi:hypothetical protein